MNDFTRETVCCSGETCWLGATLDLDSERVIFGDAQVPGAPSESPYKEVLSGWVESGLSASVSLLDGANPFASSQHLPPLSGSDPKATPDLTEHIEYIFFDISSYILPLPKPINSISH